MAEPLTEIGRGAEAVLYRRDGSVIKIRQVKSYRLPEIDSELRRFRNRREAKVMRKALSLGVPTARILSENDKECSFEMEFIDGKPLRDLLSEENYKEFCSQVGEIIAKLHSANIIHNDLTTSNMIVKHGKLFLIDFGLSFFSTRTEDRAVDLHLLRQALESKHYNIWKEAYKAVLESYRKNYPNADEVLSRLEVVEQRGRYKKKGKSRPENY